MRLHSLDLKTIQISDPFWSKHVDLVRNAIIPYQWEAMNDRIPDAESSHCLENFRIAAGRSVGEFYGAVFQDTDVAKWLESAAYILAKKKDAKLKKLAELDPEGTKRFMERNGIRQRDVPKQKQKKKQSLHRTR